MQREDWRDWREETADECALPLARRLAALLDRDPAALRAGEPLPLGWHMILFTPLAGQSQLGADGHATGGAHWGPPDLPRRMLGGRRTQFQAAVPLGASVHRTSRITGVAEKAGRSGRLAVVTLRHEITTGGQTLPSIIEEQDVLYREPAQPGGGAAPAEVDPARTALHTRSITPSPPLLFRYSAITYNAHRIHYDSAYATGTEGYPALVVNGGLTMLLLLEMLKDVAPGPLQATSARNRRPLFCDRPMTLCAAPAERGWSLWAEDDKGRIALEATAA